MDEDTEMPQPITEIDMDIHDCKILGTKAVTDLICIRLCKYHNNVCNYVKNKKNENKFKICPRCNAKNPTDFEICNECLESLIDVEITSGEDEGNDG